VILALDTGTPVGSVALVAPGRGLRELRETESITHGPTVLVTVDELLSAHGLTPQDLDAIACGRGPGSFTGLRIGLASAKGLAYALAVPLLLPSSLEALALDAPPGDGLVVPCLDARRRELFVAAYEVRGRALVCRLPPLAGSPDAVADRLAEAAPEGPLRLVGNGLPLYHEALARRLGDRARVRLDARATPSALAVADLARDQLARGEVADLRSAEPEYLRPSDAELNVPRRPDASRP
jgi:tRNA threonylcarbamoyladenosine biosynthesis protein TsaB